MTHRPSGHVCKAGASVAVKCAAGSMVSAAADVCELSAVPCTCRCPAVKYQDRDELRSVRGRPLCAKGSFTNASMLKGVCQDVVQAPKMTSKTR